MIFILLLLTIRSIPLLIFGTEFFDESLLGYVHHVWIALPCDKTMQITRNAHMLTKTDKKPNPECQQRNNSSPD